MVMISSRTQYTKQHSLKQECDIIRHLLLNHNDYQNIVINKAYCKKFLQTTKYNHLLPTMFYTGKITDIDLSVIQKPCIIKPTTLCSGHGVRIIDSCTTKQELIQYYKNLSRFNIDTDSIIIEELLLDVHGARINQEYKFYTYKGKVHIINVVNDILIPAKHTRIPFDRNWNRIHVYSGKTAPINKTIQKPFFMDELIAIVEDISTFITSHLGLSFMRIDMYMTNKGIRFGEFSYTVNGGNGYTPLYDKLIASWIHNDRNVLKK